MGFFISLLSVCAFIYLGLWLGIKVYARFYQKFFLHHKEFSESVALYLALFLGMGIFSLMSVIPFQIVAVWGFSGLGVLSFSQRQFSTKKRIVYQFLLCFSAVLVLNPVFENILFLLLLALLWLVMWRTIVWFDRFPLTTLLVSLGWTMALVMTGLMIHTLSNAVVSIVALLGTLTLLFTSYQTLQKQPVLGRDISSVLGFAWAGVWVYFLNFGAFPQTLVAFGYYLLEALFLVVAFLYHKPFQTLLSKSLINSHCASKAAKSVFFHVLLLSNKYENDSPIFSFIKNFNSLCF